MKIFEFVFIDCILQVLGSIEEIGSLSFLRDVDVSCQSLY